MSGPVRIQRRRTAGWRMPESAVYVGRPSRWGNPFTVVPEANHPRWAGPRRFLVKDADGNLWTPPDDGAPVMGRAAAETANRARAATFAVDLFRMFTDPAASARSLPSYPLIADIERDLRGRDLACWCSLDQPCHADVLLEYANAAVIA